MGLGFQINLVRDIGVHHFLNREQVIQCDTLPIFGQARISSNRSASNILVRAPLFIFADFQCVLVYLVMKTFLIVSLVVITLGLIEYMIKRRLKRKGKEPDYFFLHILESILNIFR